MRLLEIINRLEEDPDIHIARLLILLRAFAGRRGNRRINGLTKLVKLDFLLRYPVYLAQALKNIGATHDTVGIDDYEKRSIESSMIRYHYGPWDPRYRSFINLLAGKNLSEVSVRGRTITIGLTPAGIEIASKLSEKEDFKDIVHRARLLKRHFDMSGTRLKNFIYETFPEIVSLRLGERISYEDEIHNSDTSV